MIGPLGQMLRRIVNVITAVSGPVLFGLNPRLPYYVAGSLTALWTMLLCACLEFQRTKALKHFKVKADRMKECLSERRLSFSQVEQVRRMSLSKHGSLNLEEYNANPKTSVGN